MPSRKNVVDRDAKHEGLVRAYNGMHPSDRRNNGKKLRCHKGAQFSHRAAQGSDQAVLVEVPVMLLLVKIANNTKGWFDKHER